MHKNKLFVRIRSALYFLVSTVCFVFSLTAFAATESEEPKSIEVEGMHESVTSIVCPFKGDIKYDPERVRCGMISVPENRDNRESRIIRLTYAHIVASERIKDEEEKEADEKETEDKKESKEESLVVREDPVIYLTGGPGVGIESYVGRFMKHDLTKTRDLYILNQRGIGASEEVCQYFDATSREKMTAASLKEFEAEQIARMKACFSAAKDRGVDITAYNTYENARDVKSLREALGFDKWNVWGISYGSHLGQMLAQVDPEGIRALVLDAIVPNDLGDLMRIHRWIARNHKLIFDECKRQDASICEGLEERLYAAFNSLVDNPVTVEALDKEMFPSGSITATPLIVAFAPFSMQYEQDGHPAIPAVMEALVEFAESRDSELFQGLTSMMGDLSSSSQGMSNLVRCNDGYLEAQAQIASQDLEDNKGFKQGVFTVEGARMLADACFESGLALTNRDHYQMVKSDVPTLIVNGDWDPITPPPLAERIAPGFSNGRLIIVPYAGHGPTRSMSECATQVLNDFYDDPSQDLAKLDAKCLEEGVEAPEFVSYVNSDAALRLSARASDKEKGVVGAAVYLGTLLIVIISGFFAIIAGYGSRRFSSNPNIDFRIGPNTPRLLALGSSLLAIIGLILLGVGAKAAFDMSPVSFVAGLAPPANFGAIALLLSALAGGWAIYSVVQTMKQETLRRRTLIGLPLVGLSAILLFLYLASWGINPF